MSRKAILHFSFFSLFLTGFLLARTGLTSQVKAQGTVKVSGKLRKAELEEIKILVDRLYLGQQTEIHTSKIKILMTIGRKANSKNQTASKNCQQRRKTLKRVKKRKQKMQMTNQRRTEEDKNQQPAVKRRQTTRKTQQRRTRTKSLLNVNRTLRETSKRQQPANKSLHPEGNRP